MHILRNSSRDLNDCVRSHNGNFIPIDFALDLVISSNILSF